MASERSVLSLGEPDKNEMNFVDELSELIMKHGLEPLVTQRALLGVFLIIAQTGGEDFFNLSAFMAEESIKQIRGNEKRKETLQ